MLWLAIKYLVTAAVVMLVSEAAKRSDQLGGLIAALPLVTVLTLIWLQIERQSGEKIANHAWYTFWYVIPTLPMFLAFPMLYEKMGFWPTLIICVIGTMLFFAIFAFVMKRFGVNLL
jgi:uncharacterized membrane protein (GlpM family)